jgi:homoserine dehydrogenase
MGLPITPTDRIRGRYYLRFEAEDRPGVLGQIARILGDHKISIASVIQHEPEGQAAPVPLVIMTHQAIEKCLADAVAEIDRLDSVRPPSVRMRVDG